VAWEKEDLSLEEVVDEGGDKEGQENEVAQQVEGDEVNLPEKKPVSTLNSESTDCVGPRRDTSTKCVFPGEIPLSSIVSL